MENSGLRKKGAEESRLSGVIYNHNTVKMYLGEREERPVIEEDRVRGTPVNEKPPTPTNEFKRRFRKGGRSSARRKKKRKKIY